MRGKGEGSPRGRSPATARAEAARVGLAAAGCSSGAVAVLGRRLGVTAAAGEEGKRGSGVQGFDFPFSPWPEARRGGRAMGAGGGGTDGAWQRRWR